MNATRAAWVEVLEGRRLMSASMVAGGMADLTIQFGPMPSQIRSDLRTTLRVVVTNVGDAAAAGKVVIHMAGDGDTLADQAVRVRLKPGGKKTFRVHFVLPDSRNAGEANRIFPGVPVDLAATVDAGNGVAERDEGNNSVAASQVPVETVAHRQWMRQLGSIHIDMF